MTFNKSEKEILSDTERIKKLIEKRGHEYISGTYKNRESVLIVWCPEHVNEHITTFYNYGRNRTGCPCCGKAQVSKKLQGRGFSEESRKKMSEAALARPSRGGMPRRWRETSSYRNWREAVFTQFQDECAVTGFKKQKDGDLVVHHLYGAKAYPKLALTVENGILLRNDIHVLFHNCVGYHDNTLEQFLDFLLGPDLKSMLISSQGESGGSQGSETRAYDPERVMKLHERLEGLKQLNINQSF